MATHTNLERTKKLIHSANSANMKLPPWKREKILPLDERAITSIKNAGYSLQDIPDAGRSIPLRTIESTEDGGTFEDLTEAIHPDNVQIALRAARLFDLEVAGVDIISPDISRPWHENDAIINEINFSPLLGGTEISLHYLSRYLETILGPGNDGRIPIYTFTGQDAEEKAYGLQTRLRAKKINAYLFTDRRTIDPYGNDLMLLSDDHYRNSYSLLVDRNVDAIIVIAGNDGSLFDDLAFEIER